MAIGVNNSFDKEGEIYNNYDEDDDEEFFRKERETNMDRERWDEDEEENIRKSQAAQTFV